MGKEERAEEGKGGDREGGGKREGGKRSGWKIFPFTSLTTAKLMKIATALKPN